MLFLALVHYWHSQGVPVRTLGPLGPTPFYHFSPNHTEVHHSALMPGLIKKSTVYVSNKHQPETEFTPGRTSDRAPCSARTWEDRLLRARQHKNCLSALQC